jgi:beta-glucosidase
VRPADPTRGFAQLPPGFRFGTAGAAYAVEGGVGTDGRGESIWDVFTREHPERIADGSTGEVAADHRARMPGDVALLGELGTSSHRFSIAWPRVQPTGRGPISAEGLDFYDRLVDELLAAGQEPMATLYHWDLPQELEEDGGWLNRETVARFGEYADAVAQRLGDRVRYWVPVQEPGTAAILGYGIGRHAPGRRLDFNAFPAAHHLLMAHGTATVAVRAAGAVGEVGCANNHAPMWPASEDDADVGATKLFDAVWNALYCEPMLLGRYPEDLQPLLELVSRPGDLPLIRQPLDFYGVNYSYPRRVGAPMADSDLPFALMPVLGHPETDDGSPVVPAALQELLLLLRARYRAALPPLMITQAGCAYADDAQRIDWHRDHLQAVATAVRQGVDVRGYYLWSLLDGFDWSAGLTQRFGLVHVDRRTQERTPKPSFGWYRDLIAAQPRND